MKQAAERDRPVAPRILAWGLARTPDAVIKPNSKHQGPGSGSWPVLKLASMQLGVVNDRFDWDVVGIGQEHRLTS